MNTIIRRLFEVPPAALYGLLNFIRQSTIYYDTQRRYRNIKVGWGTYIDGRCSFEEGVEIWPGCRVKNTSIGRCTYVRENCQLNNCRIGKFCSIAPSVLIGLGRHPVRHVATSPVFYRNSAPCSMLCMETVFLEEYLPIEVGNDVWIGTRAIIRDGVAIGNGAVIGAGAVVTQDVPAYAIVGGVPARTLRYRFDEETINTLLSIAWWDRDPKWLEEHINAFPDVERFVSLVQSSRPGAAGCRDKRRAEPSS